MFFAACPVVCSFSLTAMAGADIAQILNPGSGKVIFVSAKSGENKNPGTKEQPVKDIDKAMKMVSDGDILSIKSGSPEAGNFTPVTDIFLIGIRCQIISSIHKDLHPASVTSLSFHPHKCIKSV